MSHSSSGQLSSRMAVACPQTHFKSQNGWGWYGALSIKQHSFLLPHTEPRPTLAPSQPPLPIPGRTLLSHLPLGLTSSHPKGIRRATGTDSSTPSPTIPGPPRIIQHLLSASMSPSSHFPPQTDRSIGIGLSR